VQIDEIRVSGVSGKIGRALGAGGRCRFDAAARQRIDITVKGLRRKKTASGLAWQPRCRAREVNPARPRYDGKISVPGVAGGRVAGLPTSHRAAWRARQQTAARRARVGRAHRGKARRKARRPADAGRQKRQAIIAEGARIRARSTRCAGPDGKRSAGTPQGTSRYFFKLGHLRDPGRPKENSQAARKVREWCGHLRAGQAK